MNSKKTISMFFSIALIGTLAQSAFAAPAQQNALSFHGRLVNAGCEAQVLDVAAQHNGHTPVAVNDQLVLEVVSHDDACHKTTLPLSTAYVEKTSVTTGARYGIVTLSYQ